ncbi:MAG TPA: hypothetical protein VK841_18420 [Polyangiaceae bacterium]|nr:hypothetical protein [Polyangiaceae bacterium]
MSRRLVTSFGAAVACLALSCGSRSPYWNTAPGAAGSIGLNSGVALLDSANSRLVMLTAVAGDELGPLQSVPVGHNVAAEIPSPDGTSLLVLSTGDSLSGTPSAEPASLTLVAPATSATTGSAFSSQRYVMQAPMPNLAVDPLGTYAVGYIGASGQSTFLQNKNEIVIFDLTRAPSTTAPLNPVFRSLRSFGGTPQQLTFTPKLLMPANLAYGATRRLLVVESEIDVTLLDLDDAFKPVPPSEITVRLTSGMTSQQITPAGVAVDPGDSAQSLLPRIAVASSNDSNVFTLTLEAATPSGPTDDDFLPSLNLTDVGGIPSNIAFVKTDAGSRLAALVPSTESAVLVEPDTSVTTSVALPQPYTNLSLVTSAVDPTATGDVAMLWNASTQGEGGALATGSAGVALWSLSKSVGQPYGSIDVLDVAPAIEKVLDVGGQNPELKILQLTGGTGFYVLDLGDGTAAPLETSETATLEVAPDGGRLWAFAFGGTNLGVIDFAASDALSTLAPIQLSTALPIDAVYDVARADGGRSLIAIHDEGTVGATVFDALNPTQTPPHQASAILLEAP